jgi:hypothetical protein
VGVLHPIIERAVLARFRAGEDLPLGSSIAFELVGDDHAWDVGQAFEQLAQALLRGLLGPTALDQDI